MGSRLRNQKFADSPVEGHSESTIRTGKLLVNLDRRIVSVEDQPVHVTGKEYGILELLSLRKGTTLTKEMFLNHLYGGMDEPELKIIDVFVCKLRKKLAQATGGKHYIETIWGRGYVLRDPVETPITLTPPAGPRNPAERPGLATA
jgi:two-component system, cell cycle response regulator CtrA